MEKFKSSLDNVIALYRKMAISNSSILENTDRFYFTAIHAKINAIIVSNGLNTKQESSLFGKIIYFCVRLIYFFVSVRNRHLC